jgi:hypothetical protein
MIHDTLLKKTLQLSRWAVRQKRRTLERAMQLGWNAETSLQIDECLYLEDSLGELSEKAVAA